MPPKPLWFKNVRRIREVVEHYDEPFLDRHGIERVFKLKPRAAQVLMHRLPSIRIGNASAVPRRALADYLLAFEHGREYRTEALRRERLRQVLIDTQKDLEARSVRFPVSPQARTIDTLPPTIQLAPGELHIRFTTLTDLLSQLFGLSRAIAGDVKKFEGLAVEAEAVGRRSL